MAIRKIPKYGQFLIDHADEIASVINDENVMRQCSENYSDIAEERGEDLHRDQQWEDNRWELFRNLLEEKIGCKMPNLAWHYIWDDISDWEHNGNWVPAEYGVLSYFGNGTGDDKENLWQPGQY